MPQPMHRIHTIALAGLLSFIALTGGCGESGAPAAPGDAATAAAATNPAHAAVADGEASTVDASDVVNADDSTAATELGSADEPPPPTDPTATQPSDAGDASDAPAASDSQIAQRMLDAAAALAGAAEQAGRFHVAGEDGWLYFARELRAISVGPFWGEAAPNVSRASRPEYADPLEPIVDFHNQLHGSGIELLIVPIPAKAVVYPKPLPTIVRAAGNTANLPRMDLNHQRFYDLLRQRGLTVLDPYDILKAAANDPDAPDSYCRTDTHFSPYACQIIAQMIARHVAGRDWLAELERQTFVVRKREITIHGDIADMAGQPDNRETLPAEFVGRATDNGQDPTPIETDRNSPVLLMGDSHTLVFHDPTLHARGAGVADHLAHQLGLAVDLVGRRGSAASSTRIDLARRRDNLAGKKLVIWLMSMREFTESTNGWRTVPVVRNP